ncbi:MAG: hypothetical protein LBU27_06185 [Candidatus Peribacteria bacterium]|nr:hypothetical protein [Candidatus Peribacteria bacterium]
MINNMADSKIERGRFHPSFQLTGTAPDGFLAVTLDTAKEGFVKVAVAGDKFLGILSER